MFTGSRQAYLGLCSVSGERPEEKENIWMITLARAWQCRPVSNCSEGQTSGEILTHTFHQGKVIPCVSAACSQVCQHTQAGWSCGQGTDELPGSTLLLRQDLTMQPWPPASASRVLGLKVWPAQPGWISS